MMSSSLLDGTYREHGREIFDEEVINTPTNEKQEKRVYFVYFVYNHFILIIAHP